MHYSTANLISRALLMMKSIRREESGGRLYIGLEWESAVDWGGVKWSGESEREAGKKQVVIL